MNILVLNAGSASLKFEVIALAADAKSASQGRKLVSGILEGIGGKGTLSVLNGKDVVCREEAAVKDYHDAASHVLEWLKTPPLESIELVGHRVVHGADCFTKPVLIDDKVIAGIEALEELAPLHNAPAVEVIRATRETLGDRKPMVAAFDTVFHCSLPPSAYTYAIPFDLAERHRIRRYGFHGLSHEYLLQRYCEITGTAPEQATIVTLHLESGCSACAIKNGRSVETSMGFTPLEGLVMGMRCGDIDPALVGYLARQEHISVEDVVEILNKKSGLKGLSGVSHDTRELEKHVDDEHARLAMDVFCHRLVKYIGAYLAVLEGPRAIVFGGGIGEDSPWIRARICSAFEWCGLSLDAGLNEQVINREARISSEGSRLHAHVIPTEEGLCVAYHALHCVRQ